MNAISNMPPPTGPPPTARPNPETDAPKYARQSRNANVVTAVILSIVFALGMISSIYIGIQVAKVANAVNSVGTSTPVPDCLSLGGTDPSC